MTSLLDIAPPEVVCKNIPIVRGDKTDILTVYPLSALDIAKLIKRFPKFRLAAGGKKLTDDELMDMGLDVSPAIITMGLRDYEEDAQKREEPTSSEKLVAERLSLDEQQVMIEAIMGLTNPEAPRKGGPFKQARGRGNSAAAATGMAQDGTSP